MWRKEYRDERPHNLGRCWWMFKQAQADCGSAPAGCAEEFRLTYIYITVKNLLYAYCVPRGRGRRNVWKPCNQPWDPIRKCLADGKHRWSCCVYIFRNKGWYPEIHDIKKPPECFARMDNEVVKRITCTSFSLMVRIMSIIVFQKKKKGRAGTLATQCGLHGGTGRHIHSSGNQALLQTPPTQLPSSSQPHCRALPAPPMLAAENQAQGEPASAWLQVPAGHPSSETGMVGDEDRK